MSFLPLYFDAGPMQSWGYGSYKKNRTTKLYPTQSAVTGMICRASGMYVSKIGQENFINFLDKIRKGKFTSILLHKDNIMTDYQTIGTNYKNDQIYCADGTKYMSGKSHGTVIVNKQYIVNAITGCIIEHNEETLEYILKSFKSPQSFLGIGRLCCIPASPIVDTLEVTFKDAFMSLVNKVNIRRETIKIEDNSSIKLVSPSINGSPINDVMIDHQQFVSRLVIEEDKTLAEWKEKLN